MRRRSRAGGEAAKTRRRKTVIRGDIIRASGVPMRLTIRLVAASMIRRVTKQQGRAHKSGNRCAQKWPRTIEANKSTF
jgi:hypothetical protein